MTFSEISLWDDPDGFLAAYEASPDAIRHNHATATRRRGGMKAVARKASMTIFGMPLHELDTEARKTLPSREKLEAAYEALRVVAGYDPDHAALDNGIGFARSDVALGHALASSSSMSALASPGTALMVWRLAMRYRRQVPPRLNLLSGFTDQSDLFD